MKWEVADTPGFDPDEIRTYDTDTAEDAAQTDLDQSISQGIVDRGYSGIVYVRPAEAVLAFKQSYQATIQKVLYNHPKNSAP